MAIKLDKRENKKKGFTLVELIVVVAILGILAAIAIPRFSQYVEEARYQKIVSDQRTVYETLVVTETKLLSDGTIVDDYSTSASILLRETNKALPNLTVTFRELEEGTTKYSIKRWDGAPTKIPSEFTIQTLQNGKVYTFFNGKDITQ